MDRKMLRFDGDTESVNRVGEAQLGGSLVGGGAGAASGITLLVEAL